MAHYLDFKPVEKVPWCTTLTVSKMLDDIIEFQKEYVNNDNSQRTEEIRTELLIDYFVNIMEGEDIGVQDRAATRKIMKEVDDEEEKHASHTLSTRKASVDPTPDSQVNTEDDVTVETSESNGKSRNTKAHIEGTSPTDRAETCLIINKVDDEEEKQNASHTLPMRKTSVDPTPDSQENAAGDDAVQSAKSVENSFPCLDSEYFEKLINSTNTKKKLETRNLYKAYKHIERIVDNDIKQTDYQTKSMKNNIGLLDIDDCILETHKILMSGLIKQEDGSGPGLFSETRRTDGDGFEFPYFVNRTLTRDAMQHLLDLHCKTWDENASSIKDEKQQVMDLFKCTSLFLNGFLLLHPFSDGNGRLARLLCGYMLLRSPFPFTLPIYNVYSSSTRGNYLQALKQARKLDSLPKTVDDKNKAYTAANVAWEQKPELLCSMLIESNWCVWQRYRKMLEDKKTHEKQEVAYGSSG